METTNEIKAKVFAQYLGQEMGYYDGTVHQPPILSKFQLTEIGFYLTKPYDRYKLILKPLSAISDEDAIAAYEIVKRESQYYINTGDSVKDGIIRMIMSGTAGWLNFNAVALLYQFLQSRGYDLPNYLLGGKTLHESELAIYE